MWNERDPKKAVKKKERKRKNPIGIKNIRQTSSFEFNTCVCVCVCVCYREVF